MDPHGELRRDSRFDLTWNGFSITVDDRDEFRHAAQRVRRDVEIHEPQAGPRGPDSFEHCHHLVVRSSSSGEPVAACCLASSMLTDRFQTAAVFALDPFLAQPGAKVELGHVYIRREWRDNLTISAIGRGLARYIHRHSAAWIFGCCRFPAVDATAVADLARHFIDNGACARGFGVLPHAKYALPGLSEGTGQARRHGPDRERIEALMPPLLRLCLKAGGGVGAEPALDGRRGQVNFFTVMGLTAHRASFLNRYLPC